MITWSNVLEDRKLMIQRFKDDSTYSTEQETAISRHRIRNLVRMSSAARNQGNFHVAKTCITSMEQLKADSNIVYNSELKLDLAKAMVEMNHNRKADILVKALSKFEEH
ncbi:hypothetical protein BGZ65_009054, partial [Modicella reniformis]